MLPDPVAIERSTLPFTERLRSNVASEPCAGTAANATAAIVAIKSFFIVLLS
jgi:hypothetical protein